ncbi:RNA polymerase sigma-70 factor [Chitinophaga sp. YIM B06452]|uniref:RNA polymerase sigma factor n=1 Tax=Chitinophaga sp. YIM B06452 TaxID=3082158 RepID=UPI0031FEDF38
MDIQLLARLQQDDTLAFAELYSRYRHEVYAYAMSLVKLPDVAEDLLQDVFVRIWDARHKIAIKKDFRPYLFRVCHNRAYDVHLEMARDEKLKDRLLHHYQVTAAPVDPFAEQDSPYIQLMEQALATLSPQRRRIYEMCKREGKSYEEVAGELGLSINTVRNHMVQAIALLRSYLQQYGKLAVLLLLLGPDFY